MENLEISSELPPITQKYLGEKGFVFFIAFLGAFIPLSTDIYLPALPTMVTGLHTSAALVNLTIVFFFIFYALGTLFWGPLSDKYGRKLILLIGLSIYLLASVLCVFASNVYLLILYRTLQSIGCGSATAVSTALVKDTFQGERRVRILAFVQSVGTTSPIISPVIGAFILRTMSWRGVFVVLALIGLVSLAGSLAMEETLQDRNTGSIFTSLARLKVVARNRAFMSLVTTFALRNVAFLAFITASSYIYVNDFGMSEQVYSYFFAANAIFLLLGPIASIPVSKVMHYKNMIKLAYAISMLSGIAMLTIGRNGPFVFFCCLAPASFFVNLIGPMTTNLMMEQVQGDNGAASSMIGSAFTLYGSVGMVIISLFGANKVYTLGCMYLLMGLVCLTAWSILAEKPYIRHF
jgi:DHA1 family bicyclomycin/chloramphenicol resistance-like MFS transporter